MDEARVLLASVDQNANNKITMNEFMNSDILTKRSTECWLDKDKVVWWYKHKGGRRRGRNNGESEAINGGDIGIEKSESVEVVYSKEFE